MIVLITVVAMTEAIVDTKVAETMVAVAIIITDAMITEATAVNGAKTTNMEMIAAAVDTAATGRIDVAAITTETEEVVAPGTMIKVAIEAMVVSRIVVPEETITVNNSHMISSIETKLTLNLIIDFTTRTTLISSAGP